MTPRDTAPPTRLRARERACYAASVVYDFSTLWTVALQSPLSTGFSRQESWTELPCPPPGDLPGSNCDSLPGSNPRSVLSPALTARFFTTSTTCDFTLSISSPPLQGRPHKGSLRPWGHRRLPSRAAASPGSFLEAPLLGLHCGPPGAEAQRWGLARCSNKPPGAAGVHSSAGLII